jgi:tetrahydromethanopterin S-methyltransferase subunit B
MRYDEWQQAVMSDLKQLNERIRELEEQVDELMNARYNEDDY